MATAPYNNNSLETEEQEWLKKNNPGQSGQGLAQTGSPNTGSNEAPPTGPSAGTIKGKRARGGMNLAPWMQVGQDPNPLGVATNPIGAPLQTAPIGQTWQNSGNPTPPPIQGTATWSNPPPLQSGLGANQPPQGMGGKRPSNQNPWATPTTGGAANKPTIKWGNLNTFPSSGGPTLPYGGGSGSYSPPRRPSWVGPRLPYSGGSGTFIGAHPTLTPPTPPPTLPPPPPPDGDGGGSGGGGDNSWWGGGGRGGGGGGGRGRSGWANALYSLNVNN